MVTYGDVTSAEGEQWGFLESVEGVERNDSLQVTVVTAVDGDMVTKKHLWTLTETALVTDRGKYDLADCKPVWDEYLRRARSKLPAPQPEAREEP